MNLKNFYQINKIKSILNQLHDFLQSHNRLILVVLILLTFLLAGIIFYKYTTISLLENTKKESRFEIDKNLYQKVLNQLEEKNKRIEEAEKKTYLDPFR